MVPPSTPQNSQPGDDAAQNGHGARGPENNGSRPNTPRPALRRTVVKPAGIAPDPVDGAYVANRLTTLVHELSTLLDGSLRVVGLARRTLHPQSVRPASEGEQPADPSAAELERHLETVDAAIRQMAELVRSSMFGMSENGAAGLRDGFGSSSSLADAVRHAAEVMAPIADEHCVRLDTQIAAELADITAGPIYPVIVNGVRNAIESIQRVGDQYVGGNVCIRAWTEEGRTGRCVMITIEDDGEGLSPGRRSSGRNGAPHREAGPSRADGKVFRLGYTTKPGGSGIGLSLCRDVIEQLGGTIELLARPRDPGSGRGGAVLSMCYPVPRVG